MSYINKLDATSGDDGEFAKVAEELGRDIQTLLSVRNIAPEEVDVSSGGGECRVHLIWDKDKEVGLNICFGAHDDDVRLHWYWDWPIWKDYRGAVRVFNPSRYERKHADKLHPSVAKLRKLTRTKWKKNKFTIAESLMSDLTKLVAKIEKDIDIYDVYHEVCLKHKDNYAKGDKRRKKAHDQIERMPSSGFKKEDDYNGAWDCQWFSNGHSKICIHVDDHWARKGGKEHFADQSGGDCQLTIEMQCGMREKYTKLVKLVTEFLDEETL